MHAARVLLLLLAAVGGASQSGAATMTVDVGPGGVLVFVDRESGTSTTTIAAGDSVKWIWMSSGHSVTRTDTPDAFDAGVQDAPFSFTHRFDAPGTYAYHCTPHEFLGMTGAVVVTGGGGTTTTLPSPPATTTTLGLSPAVTQAFAAVDDRLAALAVAVDTLSSVPRPRHRAAVGLVRRARTLEQRAERALALGRARASRGSLRQARRRLVALDRRLRVLPDAGPVLATSAGIQADLQALLTLL